MGINASFPDFQRGGAVFNLEDANAVEADLVAIGDFGLNGTEEALDDILYNAQWEKTGNVFLKK